MNPYVTIATKAARRAGAVALRNLGRLQQTDIETKSRNNFVTMVDRQAEQEIIHVLSETWPEHGFLCEESGARDEGREYRWIVDPIDGTLNYIHGYPNFSVSIALQQENTMVAAVVFDPLRDEIFSAARGEGARLNDRRIRVSGVTTLADALLVTGVSQRHGGTVMRHHNACFRTLLSRCHGIRISGSAALDIVHVACGRLEGCWQEGLSPWDVAGGALILQEAGGLAGDFEGGNGFLDSGGIVCGTPGVYEELLAVIMADRPQAPSTPSG